MKLALCCLTVLVAILAIACGTSSTTITGPSLDRCAVTVVNSMPSVGASGGNGRVAVTAGRECTWSVTTSTPWITLRPPVAGQGDGGVDYTAAANTNAEARRGTLVVGGQVLEVAQEGVNCQFDLQPDSQNMSAEGGSGVFTVEAPGGCTWTPAVSDNWITVTNGGSRSGTGSVNFTVAANTGNPREGTINVAGQTFAILQAAPSCRYQLSSTTGSFEGAGGSGTVNVTAANACSWTASTTVPWISIAAGAAGTGNGTVSFTVQPNTGPARNGIITIGGQRFTVAQVQAECNYAISPANQAFGAPGGPGTVAISTNSVCTWNTSDVPPWVTGMPASGTGPFTISFTVDPNTGPARTAVIGIAGQSFTLTQSIGCAYSLSPAGHSASANGGASSFAINTAVGCAWTGSGAPAWITGIPASGTGPQTINFTVAVNGGAARSANITVGGQTFAVTQAAVNCNYSLNPASHSATTAGGPSAFTVNTPAICNWTSGGVPAWISGIPASGTGTTTINFSVAANPDPAPRSVNITIGGQTFNVSQAAAACTYSLNPGSYNAAAAGATSSFDVNTAGSCSWTSSGVPAWITGVPASGTGQRTINFTVVANPDPVQRTANITIGGQTFTVTQAAAACNYSLSAASYNPAAAGGSSTVDVDTSGSCNWTSSGVPAWITGIPASGTGQTTISFTVAANPDPVQRTANITIAGRTFAVTQAAAAAPCAYSLNPTSYSAVFGGASSTFDVNTASGCAWTSSGAPSWVSGVPGSGTGTTSINFTVAANPNPTQRNATIVIEGQSFTITQAAAPAVCAYSLAPTTHNAAAAGGSSTFDVNTTSGCDWTSSGVPSWISGVPGSGTGQTTINFTVASNTGPARSANITIEGRTFAVSQANGCSYTVTPDSLTFGMSGEPARDVTVTTNAACPWTAAADRPWITIVSGSGPGTGTINVKLLENTDGNARQGTITVADQTVSITQTPAP